MLTRSNTAALVTAALGLLLPAGAGAQPRPVASAQVSATLGEYQPAHHAWAVVVDWRVDCVGGNRFAWTVYLRGRPNGEYVTSNGLSPVGIGRRVLLLPARGRSYEVVPEITARCFAATGDASSEYVTAYGAALAIPPEPGGAGEGGVGDDYLDPDGDFDHRRRGGDGNGHGGYGGGGTTVRLPARCENAIAGSSTDDVLNGTRGPDTLLGFDGSDRIYGLAGADCLLGHRGTDLLSGGGGPDIADGGSGGDLLAGGRGNDTLRGGPGSDRLRGNGGQNRLYGGGGNDRLDARNGRRDLVNCGRGRADVAQVDAADRLVGCELRAP